MLPRLVLLLVNMNGLVLLPYFTHTLSFLVQFKKFLEPR